MDFFIANSRSETTERTLEAETQANRQVTANTQAGSTLRFQPRPADELQFEYAYQDTRTNRTETNSSRHNGTARYLAGLSPNRSMNLVVSYSDINYDGLLPEAEFLIATIGYQQTSDALDLNVSIGHNWYKRDPLPTADDPTYNATLTWRAGGSTTISAEAFYGISDQSTSDTGNGNTGINAAFNETRGDLTLTQALGGRTNLTLGTFWGRQEYRIVPRDNESIGANIGLSRDLNRTTSVSIDASYQNRDFTDQVDDQDEWHGNVAVRHQIGRKLTFNWGVRYERREAVTTRNYEEWVGTLQLHYTFWGAGR